MLEELKLRWARARAKFARALLDRIFRKRPILWKQNGVPQRLGTCISIKAEFKDFTGWPKGLFLVWQPEGGSVRDIRQVEISKVHFDKDSKNWAFNDG